jgi:hypothetical protein
MDNVLVIENGTTVIGCDKNYSGEIIIPEGVIVIEREAFNGCSLLKSIDIPSTVTEIRCSLSQCESLSVINVSKDNKEYSSIDGVLFDKSGIKLIRYPRGKKGGYSIPKSVMQIGDWAFDCCKYLEYINIPNTVKELGRSAFFGCSSLQSIIIPNSVEKISRISFSFCTSLKSISIPKSVTEIGQFMLSHCTSLQKIELNNRHPDKIICWHYSEDDNYEKLYKETLGMYVFTKDIFESCILHVPIGTKWRYRESSIFGMFRNIQTSIGV